MPPTKKLRFDDEVLDVLRGMTWSDDGLAGYLPPGQLERNMYLAVNKALTAMGGKWNRKAKGHLFKMDPRPQVEGLLEGGVLEVEKDGFFETPPDVTWGMLNCIPVLGNILEPSAGLGAIVDQIPVPKEEITCIEKNEQRCQVLRDKGYTVECVDFLSCAGVYNTIIMNPPFEMGQDIEHVQHAYSLLAPGGWMVSVMAEGPFFRQDKKATAFREWLDEVGGTSVKLQHGAFKSSGTMVNARLAIIHRR